MLDGVELPLEEGPVPLLSLSQLIQENRKDWYERYGGKTRSIKCSTLLRNLNAVVTRSDDGKDLIVERLQSSPGGCDQLSL